MQDMEDRIVTTTTTITVLYRHHVSLFLLHFVLRNFSCHLSVCLSVCAYEFFFVVHQFTYITRAACGYSRVGSLSYRRELSDVLSRLRQVIIAFSNMAKIGNKTSKTTQNKEEGTETKKTIVMRREKKKRGRRTLSSAPCTENVAEESRLRSRRWDLVQDHSFSRHWIVLFL